MVKYRLSTLADNDIEQIFDYGIERFGLSQAQSYLVGLTQKLEHIAQHPLHYQAVDHIRLGYRRSVYRKHAIYFTLSNDYVDIMRILRSEDIAASLK